MEMSGQVAGSGFDRITFTGTADLNGTFEVAPVGGYVPDVGKFQFLTQFGAGALVGTFPNMTLPTLPSEREWRGPTYSAAEMRLLIGPLFPQHNPTIALDVDGDAHVSAADALAVINSINAFGSTTVPASDVRITPYYDTDKDNHVSPNDALEVINAINAGRGGEGDGAAPALAVSNSAAEELAEVIALLASEQPVRKRSHRIA
jgi:hypothetical protein